MVTIQPEYLKKRQNPVIRACSRTRLVLPKALGKSGLKPTFPLKSKVVVPILKFWNSLVYLELLQKHLPVSLFLIIFTETTGGLV
jgi:hypothetical protein